LILEWVLDGDISSFFDGLDHEWLMKFIEHRGSLRHSNFLGFTRICGKKRSNRMFTVLRRTMSKRKRAKLKEVKTELRKRMHQTRRLTREQMCRLVNRWLPPPTLHHPYPLGRLGVIT
jgi:retron-type reverse transcriptase